jgi:hypothetical protein
MPEHPADVGMSGQLVRAAAHQPAILSAPEGAGRNA